MSSKEEQFFPNISDILEKPDILGDILEGKVEIRLRTGKRSFEEKVQAKEARERRKVERERKSD